MNIAESEELLGLEGVGYDRYMVNVAAWRARRAGVDRRSCEAAKETLHRYIRSMERQGQFGGDRKASAFFDGVAMTRDAIRGRAPERAPRAGETSKHAEEDARRRQERAASRRAEYAAARAEATPRTLRGPGRHPLLHAAAAELWEVTPWRWFLCVWSVALAIIVWLVAFASGWDGPIALYDPLSLSFVVGIWDGLRGRLWRRAMAATARLVDSL